jgi:prepilin-type N-terminal cleavage/methylation domain-containing protein
MAHPPTHDHDRNGQRRPSRAGHGFTLLELIVAITLLLLIAAISVPPAFSIVQRQRFVSATDAVARVALETRRAAIEDGRTVELVYIEQSDAPARAGGVRVQAGPDPAPLGSRSAGARADPGPQEVAYAAGRFVVRPFDPSADEMPPPSMAGIEGAPAPADLFDAEPDDDGAKTVATLERFVAIAFPDPRSNNAALNGAATPGEPATGTTTDEPPSGEPGQPWWMAGRYEPGEHPLLVVGGDGLPLWSRRVRVEAGGRDATLAFHPVSGEVFTIERPTDGDPVEPLPPANAPAPPPRTVGSPAPPESPEDPR